MDNPMIDALIALTLPRYSGERKRASAPKDFMKLPLTTVNINSQKISNTWYFLKCRNKSCTGKE
jgi:hypothetical protein